MGTLYIKIGFEKGKIDMFFDKFCDNCGCKLTEDEEVCPHYGVKLKITDIK